MDERFLAVLRQEIACAIEDGMKAGAEHIAAALAKPQDGEAMLTLHHGVTLNELHGAMKLLIEENTYQEAGKVLVARQGTHGPTSQEKAWRTLRRALGMPT